jgi:hypothetical protein
MYIPFNLFIIAGRIFCSGDFSFPCPLSNFEGFSYPFVLSGNTANNINTIGSAMAIPLEKRAQKYAAREIE